MAVITPLQYEPAFDIAKAVIAGGFNRSRAIEVMADSGFGHASAAFYLNALLTMPSGDAYKKTISNSAARYYLQRFMDEMTAVEFSAVLLSVAAHIRYYNAQGVGKQRALAKILVEFQSRADEHYRQVLSNTPNTTHIVPSAVEPVFNEGATRTIELTIHERDPAARNACLAKFGATCQVCYFDFEKTYGEIGKGFIHVHHKVDLATIGESYQIDPINDLIPVCPNCNQSLGMRINH
jgi:5-methylcytosine-specific restriction protein A